MDERSSPVEVLMERTQAYTKTTIKLFKLKATDKLAELLSNMTSGLVIVAILILFFVNLNIGIALLAGDWLGKAWLGFIIVAAGYAMIGFVIYLFREQWIKRPVSDSIISQLLKDDLSEEDESSG